MQTVSVTIPTIGTVHKSKDGHETEWFGRVRIPPTIHDIELTIRTLNDSTPDETHIALIDTFKADYEVIMTLLLTHLENVFSKTTRKASIDKLRQMYFLTAIELKADQHEWWFTLEPTDVPTPYNFFPRFTVIDRKIEWSNIN